MAGAPPLLQDIRFSDIWICGIENTADRVLMIVRDALMTVRDAQRPCVVIRTLSGTLGRAPVILKMLN